ncbi:MAG: hypothetical protein KF729_33155 [Sandaracinaceae bacterium]|nr:hypothetical protein [Sandaracinaceae bacterium]
MLPRRSLCVLLASLAGACDGVAPASDGGLLDASVGLDAGPSFTCSEVTPLDAILDATVRVTFDTAMTETRPRDLGLVCGNTEAELRWAPQEVVALSVPGDPASTYAVEFTTNLPGTDARFNTVVQVRETCERAPTGGFPPRCFDDTAMGEYRSTGAITVRGGSTHYFIVTGFSQPPASQMTVDRGTVEIAFTVRRGDAPALTDGSLRLVLDDVRIQATGTDGDADVRGVAMNFYGPDGDLLDIFGDGEATEDGDVLIVRFDDPPALGTTWTGGVWVRAADLNLGPYLRAVQASRVGLRAYDAAWATSPMLMRPIEEAVLVGLGEACDAETYCRPEMVCSGGACIPSAAVAGLCDRAIDITVPATAEMGATVTRMGATGAGRGLMEIDPSCVAGDAQAGIGAEAIYKVDVPLARFDLLVTTDLPGTGSTDTIVLVRAACPDSGSVLACNDDVAMGNVRSSVELRDLALGSYYVIVERYRGLAMGTIPHELGVTVRPVVALGELCDAATTRCASGACTDGTCQ